jgi:hypothetical protein
MDKKLSAYKQDNEMSHIASVRNAKDGLSKKLQANEQQL